MAIQTLEEIHGEHLASDEIEVLARNLEKIRNALDLTEEQFIETIQRISLEWSELELRKDSTLATLRLYIEALGGELEFYAVFSDKRIKIEGL